MEASKLQPEYRCCHKKAFRFLKSLPLQDVNHSKQLGKAEAFVRKPLIQNSLGDCVAENSRVNLPSPTSSMLCSSEVRYVVMFLF